MDLTCATCREPWDVHHLRHGEIHETDLPREVKESWDGKLTPRVKKAFEARGWKFRGSVYSIERCPACPRGAKTDAKAKFRAEMRGIIADLLAGDEDGIAAMTEDLDDFGFDDLDPEEL